LRDKGRKGKALPRGRIIYSQVIRYAAGAGPKTKLERGGTSSEFANCFVFCRKASLKVGNTVAVEERKVKKLRSRQNRERPRWGSPRTRLARRKKNPRRVKGRG